MKTIIAGCTYMKDYSLLERAIALSGFDITEVVSNTMTGIARLGERWAIQNNIRLKKMTADWQGHGKFAGPYRNEAMAAYSDALIAIWDFQCQRTRAIIRQATVQGLHVFVPNFPEWPVWRESDENGRPVLCVKEGDLTIRFARERNPEATRASERDVIAIYFDGVPERDREARHQNQFFMNSFDAGSIHPILEDYHEQLLTWCSDVQKEPYIGPMKAERAPEPLPETESASSVLFICGREPLTRAQREALAYSNQICAIERACFPMRRAGLNFMIEPMQPVLSSTTAGVCHGRVEVRGDDIRFVTGDRDLRVSTVCAAMPASVEPLECFQSTRMREYTARAPLWWLSAEGCWFRLTPGGTIIEEAN